MVKLKTQIQKAVEALLFPWKQEPSEMPFGEISKGGGEMVVVYICFSLNMIPFELFTCSISRTKRKHSEWTLSAMP